jgi:hypothetical protein
VAASPGSAFGRIDGWRGGASRVCSGAGGGTAAGEAGALVVPGHRAGFLVFRRRWGDQACSPGRLRGARTRKWRGSGGEGEVAPFNRRSMALLGASGGSLLDGEVGWRREGSPRLDRPTQRPSLPSGHLEKPPRGGAKPLIYNSRDRRQPRFLEVSKRGEDRQCHRRKGVKRCSLVMS